MKKLLSLLFVAMLANCNNSNSPEDPERIDIESLAADPDIEFVFFESNHDQFLFLEEQELPGFSNTYLYYTNQNGRVDQLNINMTNTETGNLIYHCGISITGSALHTRSFPYVVAQVPRQSATIVLMHKTADVPIQFGPEDRYNFGASSLQNRFSMQVTSFQDGVLEATFTGTMKTQATGDDREIAVKNGRLRVRIEQ